MKYSQADVVEVSFPLPNGQMKNHPAIILSNREVYEAEEMYYAVMLSTKDYNEVFTIVLSPSDFDYTTRQTSYVKCQLIETFEDFDIIQRFGKVKPEPFRRIITHINKSVFSFEC